MTRSAVRGHDRRQGPKVPDLRLSDKSGQIKVLQSIEQSINLQFVKEKVYTVNLRYN